MIKLNPPLPVVAGGHPGFVTGMSATHARVEWSDGIKSQPAPTSAVISTGTKQYKIAIKSADNQLIQFAESSLAVALDLLHGLRKGQHIDLCATEDVEHSGKKHGFDAVTLPVVALPEVAWNDVSTSTTFMGRTFSAPILITGMTGGVARGTLINERLARAASQCGVPMGVGSQRMALENPEHAGIFKLKDKFKDLFLIGNIGIGQLREANYLDLCKRAVEMINADALAIHVNVLQELIQEEGDRDFRGLLDKIANVSASLAVQVIVKEVGAGLDVATAKALNDRGVKYFDVGGSGGTSWAHIEGLRSDDSLIRRRGEIFRDWGIPTAEAVSSLRREIPDAQIIATGGIRDGLTALKALYIGANMVGIGLPLMRAALVGDDEPANLLRAVIQELKIAKICSGSIR